MCQAENTCDGGRERGEGRVVGNGVREDPGCERNGGEGAAAERKSVRDFSPRELGREGEQIAASYLERRGYDVLERNWVCKRGEADIIARDRTEDENSCVLIEVKTRLALGTSSEALPELAVDADKQRRYRSIALAYMYSHPRVVSVRFDVIAINIVGERSAKLRHLVGAYCLDE